MAQQDDVSISTQTEHTTELARVLKQYTVAHDKWQALTAEANRLMEEATVRESQAEALQMEVAELKAKLGQALGGPVPKPATYQSGQQNALPRGLEGTRK